MREMVLSRRSALSLALLAAGAPIAARARQATPGSAIVEKLAEQTVELSDRGVIWQVNTLQSIVAGDPSWPFHAGFLVALEAPLTVLDADGAPVANVEPDAALAVAEKTYLAPTSPTDGSQYLAIELVGQDDSDSPYRRPFKADPGEYMLTLWSLAVDAGTDDEIAAIVSGNLPGAPVMIAVRSGGVAIASSDGSLTTQILQGSWDAVDTDRVITVPGGVSPQLLIATISATGGGGDDDLGRGNASASTTSSSSSIVETSLPGITLLNYRTASLDAGELTWQIVTGLADQEPVETRYHRGFITALTGPIALIEEDGTFRRVGGGKAITVRNGDRFSALSLSGEQEPFLAIELLAADEASDPTSLSFSIADDQFTFELWRVALQNDTIDALGVFMQDSPFPALVFVQRGEIRITSTGASSPDALAAGAARVVAPGATFELTGTSASILIGRLLPL